MQGVPAPRAAVIMPAYNAASTIERTVKSILAQTMGDLLLIAVDVSGRAHLSYDAAIPTQKIGDFDTELVKEFWLGFVRKANVTLHIRSLAGENSHHIVEGMFKAAARALSAACAVDPALNGEIPSTKGVL